MAWYSEILDFLNELTFLGRSGSDYVVASIVFLTIIGIFYVFKFIIVGRFESYLSQRENASRVETLVKGLKKVLSFRFVFLLSIYLSVQTLEPDKFISDGLKFLLLLIITYFLLQFSFLLVDYLIEFRSRKVNESANILEFFRLVMKSTLFIILFLWFLANLGVNTDVFIASVGVFSLAIAFSLQNVIADIFASLTIYIDKPIEIGDTIAIAGEMGTVEKIGIRSTRLRTLQGNMLIIANKEILNSRISNFQKMERRRVPFVIGVHYNTSPSVLREIPVIVGEIINSIQDTRFDRAFLNKLSASSIDFEVVYFVLSKSYTKYLETHEKVTMKIIETFREKNIVIPYPSQSIYLENTIAEVN